MEQQFTGYILSHTHWDREWYLTFQQLRIRLVHLLDELIPYLEEHPEFTNFHLDGQTVCLEDYLEVRPDQRERLASLIQAERISAGPWYVLPDLLCIHQESVLRNLNYGQEIASGFGPCTAVGYLPDIFSHTSQLPQIFCDYGFAAAMIWRGASGETEELMNEVNWYGPDGSCILTLHLPDKDGYLNAFPLADSPEEVCSQFEGFFSERRTKTASGHLLFMNGCDHQRPNYSLPDYIRYFNERHTDLRLQQTSLTGYLKDLIPKLKNLPSIYGEQSRTNHTAGRNLNPTLKNTLSSRIPQKLENYRCEALLIRYAEPLSAMLAARGLDTKTYFLKTAWKYLLQNHPHDSICGCSCDGVHRDMDRRFSWSREISEQYIREAMDRLAVGNDALAGAPQDGFIPMHLFSLLPFPVCGQVHRFTLRLPDSAFFRDIEVTDREGRPLPSQLIGVSRDGKVLAPHDKDPSWDDYVLTELLVEIPQLPAMGAETVFCRPSLTPCRLPMQRRAPVHTLENEYMAVCIRPNGTLDITDKASGRCYRDMHFFTDEWDIGDEYLSSPPPVNPVWNSYTQAPSLEFLAGDLADSAVLTWEYSMKDYPSGHTCAFDRETFESQPSASNRIVTTVTLEKNSPLLKFHSRITNRTHRHRIQLRFPSGMCCQESFADSHFDIVCHPILQRQPSKEAWVENESGCFSQKRFVYLEEGGDRMMFLSRGLLEYEVVKGCHGQELAVTLLRSVDRIGSDRSMTAYAPPGPKNVYTPDALLPGSYEVEYALAFPSGSVSTEMTAELYHSPCCYYQRTTIPPFGQSTSAGCCSICKEPFSLFQIDPSDFVLSSVRAVGDDAYILRGCNLGDREQETAIHFSVPPAEIWTAGLDDSKRERIPIQGESLVFSAAPRKILSFLISLR